MKTITLTEVITEQCKNKKFEELFQRELLINEIAKVVVAMRKKSRLTQKKLAEKAGTTQPVIARLESGTDKRIPSLNLLVRLAVATNSTLKLIISHLKN